MYSKYYVQKLLFFLLNLRGVCVCVLTEALYFAHNDLLLGPNVLTWQ